MAGSALRLALVAAAIEMLLGIGIQVLPQEFDASLYVGLRPALPYLSTALMGGAVTLLVMVRYPLSAWTRRTLVLLPAAPLVWLGVWAAQTAVWPGVIQHGLFAVFVLAMPWIPQRTDAAPTVDRDMAAMAQAVIQTAVGLLALIQPTALAFPDHGPDPALGPLLGISGLLGAAALASPFFGAPLSGWARWVQRLAPVLLPVSLAYDSVRLEHWTGLVVWGSWAVALLWPHITGAPRLARGFLPEAAGTPTDELIANLERMLEAWTWLVALALVVLMGFGGADALVSHTMGDLVVVGVSGYNALMHWLLPRWGRPAQRLNWHMLFLTAAAGFLHITETGPVGHGFLLLVAAMPPLATRALGRWAGERLLLLGAATVVLGEILHGGAWSEMLSHSVAELVPLVLATSVGMRSSGQHRRVMAELQTNMAERMRTEEALRQSEERFRSAFAYAAIGKALVSLDGRYLQVNRAFCDMVGYTEAELLAASTSDITHPDDLKEQARIVEELRTGNLQANRREKRYVHKQGHLVWAMVTVSEVRDGAGSPLYHIVEMQDITQHKQHEEQLQYLANHDPLTKLLNRRRFQEELVLHVALAVRYKTPGALLMLDLDEFKMVNDSLGQHVGDEMLVSVSHLLRDQLRETDVLARLGGDEFAILLPRADAAQAQTQARLILEAVSRQPFVAGGQPLRITASIGIALCPDHGVTAEQLLAQVDLAMYRAKAEGGNRIVLFAPGQEWQQQMAARRTWELRIREALDHGQFTLHFQPILDLRTGQVAHYEALLRMVESSGALVLPGAFLGVAERSGLITEIDRWVVRQVIRLLASHQRLGRQLTLGINLSGRAFADDDLLALIQHEFTATGAQPARLTVEITETAAIADVGRARRFIRTLKELGCRFALDDFGMGYSSFAHLKDLAVDHLKIDGSFVRNLPRDPVDQHLVAAMVQVAHGLGKTVIAEFVEDAQILRMLQAYGVDFAQGYHIGPPRPGVELWGDFQAANATPA